MIIHTDSTNINQDSSSLTSRKNTFEYSMVIESSLSPLHQVTYVSHSIRVSKLINQPPEHDVDRGTVSTGMRRDASPMEEARLVVSRRDVD